MRLRLLLSFVLVVVASVLGVVIIARQGAAREVRAFMLRGTSGDNAGLAGELESYYAAQGSWEGVAEFLQTTPHQPGRGQSGQGTGGGAGNTMINLWVADASGVLQASSGPGAAPQELSRAQISDAIPLEVNGLTVGYLYAEGEPGYSRNQEILLLSRITRAAWIAGLIAGSLALLLAIFLARRLLVPVHSLTAAAEKLAEGDLSQRVPVNGHDELARLGDTFNSMAASLQNAEESRRAMTADIAHELRTPLAIQRAQLEALQDGVYPLTTDNLQQVLEQNHLLTRLVSDLRTLAMADAGQLELIKTQTDIVQLLGRLVERFRVEANQREIQMNLSAPIDCPTVAADAARLDQIMGNLISNALRYSPNGSRIDLEIRCQDSQIQIAIHDQGPGIPEEALPHLFERFFRADKARSRETGGTGLGLAIARQLARAHGGELTASNHPAGGALFTLTLPLIGDRHEVQ